MSKNSNVKKTLDTQHLNKLQEFQDKDAFHSKLRADCARLSSLVQDFKARGDLADSEFERYMQAIDDFSDAKRRLERLESQEAEIDYYINSAPILFQYYDILENGKEPTLAKKPSAGDKSILKYFMGGPPPKEETKKESAPVADRATLLEKYLHATDPNYIKPAFESEPRDRCPHCGTHDRNVMVNDGLIYCNDCSTIEYIIVDHERPSYKDPPKEISYFAYKRINHFNEFKNELMNCFRQVFECSNLLKVRLFFKNLSVHYSYSALIF